MCIVWPECCGIESSQKSESVATSELTRVKSPSNVSNAESSTTQVSTRASPNGTGGSAAEDQLAAVHTSTLPSTTSETTMRKTARSTG